MPQNMYDNPEFFAGYSQLGRSTDGLDGAAEWPALCALLPPLEALAVLDLGCGFGWFARWAREVGAASVLGLDISENMLARAGVETCDCGVTYRRADLESVSLEAGAYDLAFSSLAFHYIEDLVRLLSMVLDALKPGGRLVFSIEHPIYMAPREPRWWHVSGGHKAWPIDGYAAEGLRTTDWLSRGVVKYHRRLATTINMLIDTGFTIDRVVEWSPTDAEIARRPELAQERERPMFLLVAARRGGG